MKINKGYWIIDSKKIKFKIQRKEYFDEKMYILNEIEKNSLTEINFKNLNYYNCNLEEIIIENKKLTNDNILKIFKLNEIFKKKFKLEKKLSNLKEELKLNIKFNKSNIKKNNIYNSNKILKSSINKKELLKKYKCFLNCKKSYNNINSLYYHLKINHNEFWKKTNKKQINKLLIQNKNNSLIIKDLSFSNENEEEIDSDNIFLEE